MKITKSLPRDGTERTRRVFALLPYWFEHGTYHEPLRTMVWLGYYLVEERWSYGRWSFIKRKLEE